MKSFGRLFGEAIVGLKAIAHLAVPLVLLLFLLQAALPAFFSFLPAEIDAVLSFPVLLAGFVFFFVSPIVLLQALSLRDQGQQVEFREALGSGFGVLIPYGIAVFIAGLVRLGAFVPFIIPGIIVSVFLIFVEPAAAIEGRRGFDALARSWALVKGSWRSIFGRLFLFWIFVVAVMLLMVLPVLLVTQGVAFWNIYQTSGELGGIIDETAFLQQAQEQLTIPQLISSAWMSAIGIAVLFLSTAFDFVLFRNLVAMKGGVVDEKKGKLYGLFAWGIVAGGLVLALVVLAIAFIALKANDPGFLSG